MLTDLKCICIMYSKFYAGRMLAYKVSCELSEWVPKVSLVYGEESSIFNK
jgi:hypothetical protein